MFDGIIRFSAGVDRKLVYWITLVTILRAVCSYWEAHRDELPDDLSPTIEAAAVACDLACAAIREYDLAHKRGKFQQAGDAN